MPFQSDALTILIKEKRGGYSDTFHFPCQIFGNRYAFRFYNDPQIKCALKVI